ncbi:hypothetical protein INR49_022041 [Caranx melampygus]|nr:hypothetical protein INR49_022041 [Caranx melampygus]
MDVDATDFSVLVEVKQLNKTFVYNNLNFYRHKTVRQKKSITYFSDVTHSHQRLWRAGGPEQNKQDLFYTAHQELSAQEEEEEEAEAQTETDAVAPDVVGIMILLRSALILCLPDFCCLRVSTSTAAHRSAPAAEEASVQIYCRVSEVQQSQASEKLGVGDVVPDPGTDINQKTHTDEMLLK